MHTTITAALAVTACLAPALLAQTPAPAMEDRVFTFQHADTVQQFQEIANLIRTLMEIRDVKADNDQKSLTVHGTLEQVTVAGWLVKQLDQPVAPIPDVIGPEYKGVVEEDNRGHPVPGAGVVQLLYLPHAATVQDFQEIANALRTVSEIRRAFTYNAAHVIAVRGTPEQIGMAEWIASELDRASVPQTSRSASSGEYTVVPNDVMRVFYVSNAKSVQDFQEIANATRTTAEIRRVFTYNTARAVVVRGTSNDLAMAQWLLTELDQPASSAQAVPEYRVPGAADDIVRVYHLPQTASVQEFQTEANTIRSSTGIRRVFTYNAQRALAMRGTLNQLALAENLMQDLSSPLH